MLVSHGSSSSFLSLFHEKYIILFFKCNDVFLLNMQDALALKVLALEALQRAHFSNNQRRSQNRACRQLSVGLNRSYETLATPRPWCLGVCVSNILTAVRK